MVDADAPVLAASPSHVRDELDDLTRAQLHGPLAGDIEEIEERPRDQYLLGALAPQQFGWRADPTERSTDDTAVDSEDEGAAKGLYPSSFGLTFTVDRSVDSLLVVAGWGRYRRESTETPEGDTKRIWRRYPAGGSLRVELVDGPIEKRSPDPENGDVVVTGLVRERADCFVVTLFLVNEQQEQQTNKDDVWLFQARLGVAAPDERPVFVQTRPDVAAPDDETAMLDMLYRHHVEFATGHGTAVHVTVDGDDPARAHRIETSAVPTYDVPQTRAPSADDIPELAEVVLDMSALAEVDDLAGALIPMVEAYRTWIAERRTELETGTDGLADHREAGREALAACGKSADRIEAGIELLANDDTAARAFRFMNRAMALQRLHTTAAELRRADPDRKLADVLEEIDVAANRSWRPFQLAFVLVNLPSLSDPTLPERSTPGLVDLLWFPTGGGKTEAYLGLCAYTMGIRRLHGEVDGHAGHDGVAIIMRYTLRLLTAQQFQRASALMCACEVLRQEALDASDNPWGEVPFRIGLWVGFSVTPTRGSAAAKAIEQARDRGRDPRGANPVQLAACPWCGNEISTSRQADYDAARQRTIVHCSDRYGRCPFGRRHAPDEGLPVVTVDDEIYRLLPDLVIATADKFAQLPWQGAVTSLFGRVTERCERHGYRTPDLDRDIDERDSHRARAPLPAAKTVSGPPLRPPDLIIQDELHLMTGPLGSLAGLYETAIDELCTWTVDGQRVRPKVVASTATARRASEQARALFDRDLHVFPPSGLTIDDSFFARQVPVSDENPGRRYLGICAQGTRLKNIEIRVYTALLAGAQSLFEKYGQAADPYMTLVGYFSSIRELGGMRRLVDDDVRSRLRKAEQIGLKQRQINDVKELTSRIDSSQIPATLDRLGVRFGGESESGWPIDVLLATSMISVGVDVPRLGLMVVGGQPKATAEYIQATSRVGRSAAGPGLVVTLANWARPRDLSHYERFEHYHATFYRHVEATTLTPFAPRALDRGLTAVLAGLMRHRGDAWNANESAALVDVDAGEVQEIVDLVAARAESVTGDPLVVDEVRRRLGDRRRRWSVRQARQRTGTLGYRERQDGRTTGLLRPPSEAEWDPWVCPHSLREVEPGINLLFDDTDYAAFGEPDYVYDDSSSVDGVSGDEAHDGEVTTAVGSQDDAG